MPRPHHDPTSEGDSDVHRKEVWTWGPEGAVVPMLAPGNQGSGVWHGAHPWLSLGKSAVKKKQELERRDLMATSVEVQTQLEILLF